MECNGETCNSTKNSAGLKKCESVNQNSDFYLSESWVKAIEVLTILKKQDNAKLFYLICFKHKIFKKDHKRNIQISI